MNRSFTHRWLECHIFCWHLSFSLFHKKCMLLSTVHWSRWYIARSIIIIIVIIILLIIIIIHLFPFCGHFDVLAMHVSVIGQTAELAVKSVVRVRLTWILHYGLWGCHDYWTDLCDESCSQEESREFLFHPGLHGGLVLYLQRIVYWFTGNPLIVECCVNVKMIWEC